MAARGKIAIDRERCKGCHVCLGVCRSGVIEVDEVLNRKGYSPALFVETSGESDDKGCTGCRMCALVCPEVAIEVYRAQ